MGRKLFYAMIPSWIEDFFEFYVGCHLCGVYFVSYAGATQIFLLNILTFVLVL